MPPWMVLVIAVPFDFHIAGAVLKEWASEAQEQWLTEGDNFEKFSSGKLTMSERRVLMTYWIGYAWERMKLAKNAEMRYHAFGALLGCLELLGQLLTTILPTLLLPPWVVLATRALADPHLVTIVAATLDLDLSC